MQQGQVSKWTDIVDISMALDYTVGLKGDGTVVAVGNNSDKQCNVSHWKDIVAIAAGNPTVGLKANGTVVATGYNKQGNCDLSDWRNIVAVAVGNSTIGLTASGTVEIAGGYIDNWDRKAINKWRLFDNIDTLEQEKQLQPKSTGFFAKWRG